MAHRFFLGSIKPDGDSVTITDQKTIHQIATVLRMKKNDVFFIFSNNIEYELKIREITPQHIIAAIRSVSEPDREPKKTITLYQSLLKKENFELVVQKATELGVQHIVPLVCANTIVRKISPNKQQRYQKIIKEATEQCGGKKIPALKPPMAIEQALNSAQSAAGMKIAAWEGEKSTPLINQVKKDCTTYHLFIGPEGGFTAQEITIMHTHKIITVTLGSRILRAETAAITAISLILLGK